MFVESDLLPDLQASPDLRGMAIPRVGVRALRYPIALRGEHGTIASVAQWAMYVGLPATVQGTHMSRFAELLEAHTHPLDLRAFRAMLLDMCARLGAASGHLEARFPYFIRKYAPASGLGSLLDYDVTWTALRAADGTVRQLLGLEVAITSLCPCSKAISAYGAHNQRSTIGVEVELAHDVSVETLARTVEAQASCEVYTLLKRADEKHVTERAYENPKFVEDLVRDVARALGALDGVRAFAVRSENFESIHNHSAYAEITSPGWRAR
ncbi:MAG: GTP cyclohydrolase FolE2 [Mizugakiibacter sp.]|uniref:GTP cyclohydrolase FolE2 n=1 Tax=Mizugakiibacter sp. TaxID=1972610 RepID=UPI0031C40B1D|nr:GTP cyclohydrolase FolE2 [Xanthomonadaceae bacterium]